MPYAFIGELWIWDTRESDSWTFVTLSREHSDELRDRAGPRTGFGSIRVEVTLGASTWRTSLFPDKESGGYILPIKAAVRKAENIAAGDKAKISLSAL